MEPYQQPGFKDCHSLAELKNLALGQFFKKPNYQSYIMRELFNKLKQLVEMQQQRQSNSSLRYQQSLSISQDELNTYSRSVIYTTQTNDNYELNSPELRLRKKCTQNPFLQKDPQQLNQIHTAKELLEIVYLAVNSYSIMNEDTIQAIIDGFTEILQLKDTKFSENDTTQRQKKDKPQTEPLEEVKLFSGCTQKTKEYNLPKENKRQNELESQQNAESSFRKHLHIYKPQFLQIFFCLADYVTLKSVFLLTKFCHDSYKMFRLHILDIEFLFQIIVKMKCKFNTQSRLSIFLQYLQNFIQLSNGEAFKNKTYLASILKILSKKRPNRFQIDQSFLSKQNTRVEFLTPKEQNFRYNLLLHGGFVTKPIAMDSLSIQIHQSLFSSILNIIVQRGEKDSELAWKLAVDTIKARFSARMVKNMLRKLQIKSFREAKGKQKNKRNLRKGQSYIKSELKEPQDQICPLTNYNEQWRDILKLMKISLELYRQTHSVIKFQHPTAYVVRKLESYSNHKDSSTSVPNPSIFEMILRTFPKEKSDESLLITLFTKQKREYWIMIREYYDTDLKYICSISIVEVKNGMINKKTKTQFKQQYPQKKSQKEAASQTEAQLKEDGTNHDYWSWQPIWKNVLWIQLTTTAIKLGINLESNSSSALKDRGNEYADLCMEVQSCKFTGFAIGGGVVPSSIDELYTFNYYPYLTLQELYKYKLQGGEINNRSERFEDVKKRNLLRMKWIPEFKLGSIFSKFKLGNSSSQRITKEQLLKQSGQKRKNIQIQHEGLYEQMIQLEHTDTVLTTQNSFIENIRLLGDLDLFFLITSHIIKKQTNPSNLLQSLDQIMIFFGSLVKVKGVERVQLSPQDQKNRVSNILCLCWFASKEIPSNQTNTPCSKFILKMLRFLGVRGGGPMRKIQIAGILQVLCNFGFWQKLHYKQQLNLIAQVRNLFRESISLIYQAIQIPSSFSSQAGGQSLRKRQMMQQLLPEEFKTNTASQNEKKNVEEKRLVYQSIKYWHRLLLQTVFFYRSKISKTHFNSALGNSLMKKSLEFEIQEQDQTQQNSVSTDRTNNLKLQAHLFKTLEVYNQQLIEKLFSIQSQRKAERAKLDPSQRNLTIIQMLETLFKVLSALLNDQSNNECYDRCLAIQLSYLIHKMARQLFQIYVQSKSLQQLFQTETSSKGNERNNIMRQNLKSCEQIMEEEQGRFNSPPRKQKSTEANSNIPRVPFPPDTKAKTTMSAKKAEVDNQPLLIFNKTPDQKTNQRSTTSVKGPCFSEEQIYKLSEMAKCVIASRNSFYIDNSFQIYRQTDPFKLQKVIVSEDMIKVNLSQFIVYFESMKAKTYKHLIYRKPVEEYQEFLYQAICKIHLLKDDCSELRGDVKDFISSFKSNNPGKLSKIFSAQQTTKQKQIEERLFNALASKEFKKVSLRQQLFDELLRYYIMENCISTLPPFKIISFLSKQYVSLVEKSEEHNQEFLKSQSVSLSNIKFIDSKRKKRVMKILQDILESLMELCAFQLQPESNQKRKQKNKTSFRTQDKANKAFCKIHLLLSMFSELHYDEAFNVLTLLQVCSYHPENLQILKIQLAVRQLLHICKSRKKFDKQKQPKCATSFYNIEKQSTTSEKGLIQKQKINSPLQQFLSDNGSFISQMSLQKSTTEQQKFHENLTQITYQLQNIKNVISNETVSQVLKCSIREAQIHKQNLAINIYDGLIRSVEKINPKEDSNYFQLLREPLQRFRAFLEIQLLPLIQTERMSKIQRLCPELKLRQQKLNNRKMQRRVKANKTNQVLPQFRSWSYQLFENYVQERRKGLLSVQKIWSSVQQNNRYFWELFYGGQKWYSLDSFTNPLKMPIMLKVSNEKPELDLPKMNKNQSQIDKFSRYYGSIVEEQQNNSSDQMHSNSQALFKDTSKLYGDNYSRKKASNQKSQHRSNLFESTVSHQLQNESNTKGKNLRNLQIKDGKYKVFLITVDKIYYGKLSVFQCRNFSYCQFQEEFCHKQRRYDNICAHDNQRRTEQDIQKNKKQFRISLNRHCRIIKKKYLFSDCALQLYSRSENSTYFFCFTGRGQQQRDHFVSKIIPHNKLLNYREHNSLAVSQQNLMSSQELVKVYEKQWQFGIITNFEYLMKVNDCSGRTFNDLSQYYVFPWTIKDFSSETLKTQIYPQKAVQQGVYRDLTRPMGMVNPDRFQTFKKRYRDNQGIYGKSQQEPERRESINLQKDSTKKGIMSYLQLFKSKQIQRTVNNSAKRVISEHNYFAEAFLYGSFYSNPAVICNYLLRVNPFSTHHYLLQTKKFDHADRLFFSMKQQFLSSTINLSDLKQLTPQFYCNWEFLINRSSWELGVKQDKAIVNDVILPKWVEKSSGRPQQFIFKMRQALQSAYSTANIHKWIDLIFGWKNQKSMGIKQNNLFPATVYDIKMKGLTHADKESIIMCYKQFGQSPRCIFPDNHPQFGLHLESQGREILIKQTFAQYKISNIRKKTTKQAQYQDTSFTKNQPLGKKKQQQQCPLLSKFRKQTMSVLHKKMNLFRKVFEAQTTQAVRTTKNQKLIYSQGIIFVLKAESKLLYSIQHLRPSENKGITPSSTNNGAPQQSVTSSISSILSSFTKKKDGLSSQIYIPQQHKAFFDTGKVFQLRQFDLNSNQTEKNVEQRFQPLQKGDFYEKMNQSQKQYITDIQIMDLIDVNNVLRKVILYLRNGNLYFREIRQAYTKENVVGMIQFTKERLLINRKTQYYEAIRVCKQFIVLVQGNILHFFAQKQLASCLSELESLRICEVRQIGNPRIQYCLINLPEFIQHDNSICHCGTSASLSLCVSVDLSNRVFVLSLQLPPYLIFVRYSFFMKELMLTQKVCSLMIHDMGFIIIMTSLYRVLVYNLMGELVVSSLIQMINQDISKIERINTVGLFSHQRPQLIFATNLGRLYKVNIFDMKKSGITKLSSNKEHKSIEKVNCQYAQICSDTIQSIGIDNIGRHWQIITLTQQDQLYAVRSHKYQAARLLCSNQYRVDSNRK